MGDAPDFARRRFLRGQSPQAAGAVRPPGALSPGTFFDACTTCGDCVSACPEQIIVHGEGGYPEVRFQKGECTFCNACVDACREPALSGGLQPPWQLDLRIDAQCLAGQGVVCQSCRDACGERAIRFPPLLGRVAVPEVNADACTGCGACVAACPADAMALAPRAEHPGEAVAHG